MSLTFCSSLESFIFKMNAPIVYRPALKEDCRRLAELMEIAAGGMLDFLFHDLVPGLTPVDIETRALENHNSHYSFRNAIVAEHLGSVAGMALSFPAVEFRITGDMRQFIPRERLDHLNIFFSARVESSFFLDALAVDEELRGNGIGSQLIGLAKQKAENNGHESISLMVFRDNHDARRLYARQGFEAVRDVAVERHPRIPHDGGCLLLNCPLRGS